ncbi:MAG: hypothetical protein AAFN94_05330 [Pseudomonadota bacterium]
MFRVFFIVFIALSIVYISLSLYSRARARARLEEEWSEGPQDLPQEAYVNAGLKAYDGSLRRKLILGVYVVPMALVGLIIYLTNFA